MPILYNFNLKIVTFSDNECLNFCSGKANSLGLGMGTTNECVCDKSFWNPTTQTCDVDCLTDPTHPRCQLDCTPVQYATGIVTGIIPNCTCMNLFFFQ